MIHSSATTRFFGNRDLQSANYLIRNTLRALAAGRRAEKCRTWGATTAEQQRIKDLEREVRELRKTNEILKLASAYFAQAELDRHHRK